MMSVLEYATDVDLSVDKILELCKKLNINVNSSEDELDDESIILLDNEIENGDFLNDDSEDIDDDLEEIENDNKDVSKNSKKVKKTKGKKNEFM